MVLAAACASLVRVGQQCCRLRGRSAGAAAVLHSCQAAQPNLRVQSRRAHDEVASSSAQRRSSNPEGRDSSSSSSSSYGPWWARLAGLLPLITPTAALATGDDGLAAGDEQPADEGEGLAAEDAAGAGPSQPVPVAEVRI